MIRAVLLTAVSTSPLVKAFWTLSFSKQQILSMLVRITTWGISKIKRYLIKDSNTKISSVPFWYEKHSFVIKSAIPHLKWIIFFHYPLHIINLIKYISVNLQEPWNWVPLYARKSWITYLVSDLYEQLILNLCVFLLPFVFPFISSGLSS